MAGAINYCLNQWNPLTVFLGDGTIAIHNNIAEQEMKRIYSEALEAADPE